MVEQVVEDAISPGYYHVIYLQVQGVLVCVLRQILA
jgi:hypothetical protein